MDISDELDCHLLNGSARSSISGKHENIVLENPTRFSDTNVWSTALLDLGIGYIILPLGSCCLYWAVFYLHT